MNDGFKKVKWVLWIILIANLTVAMLKIIVGSVINSTSMTADGFHSLTDGSSNIIGLIGIHFASKPVDEDHPYGHRKFEILAGMFIAVMLFILGGRTIMNAIDRLRNPVLPNITLESLVILILTLCINIFVSTFEYKKGKKLNSQILISDSLHTRSDIYVSAGVLITLGCVKIGLPPMIDPVASFIVAGFIFHSAYEIFVDNSGILVDKAAVDTERIRSIALDFEEVKDTHNIRSRGCKNDLHIDMHIMTEPDLSVEKSHELIHNIEERIKDEININIQVIAHLEPFNDGNDNNN
jgi:cation diffusion facilitator family transporter